MTKTKPPVKDWKATTSEETVYIPDSKGNIVEKIPVKVPAWEDCNGNIFLDEQAREKLDSVKARHMGLLTSDQLKNLRKYYNLSQADITNLLQTGGKSWCRWETGKERPSRSMNILLCAIYDGEITIGYLRDLLEPKNRLQRPIQPIMLPAKKPIQYQPEESCLESLYPHRLPANTILLIA